MLKMNDEKITDPASVDDEEGGYELSLRPLTLDEYIGQESVKENLSIAITAAKKREGALDHVLFYGPPGLGKTTLAHIIANELGSAVKLTSGPIIQKAGDLAAILTTLTKGDVLFIDEIHRLSPPVEEILYPAMEDYAIDIMIGQGPAARSISLSLPPFTLVGATTRAGLLTSPLRDRFGLIHRLDFYTAEELMKIVKRGAKRLEIEIDDEGAKELAGRSRGTPRIALRLLRRVRDFAEVRGDGRIGKDSADKALAMLEVDKRGLDKMDRRMMRTIIETFGGGPVGVDSISAAISEERETIEDVLEPFMIQEGFIKRTSRGRVATPLAYHHFGLNPSTSDGQPDIPFDLK